MKKIKYLKLSLPIISVLGFFACSYSPSENNNLSFPSNSVNAESTLENGEKVRDIAAKNQKGNIIGLNSVNNNSKINMALLTNQIAQNISKEIKNVNLETYSLNQVINETKNCSSGGTIKISGNSIEKNSIILNATANDCNKSGVIINGTVHFDISDYDNNSGKFKKMSLKFTSDFEVRQANNEYARIYKNSIFIINSRTGGYGALGQYSLDMTIQATDETVKRFGLENCKFDFNETSDQIFMYQREGKLYLDNLSSYVIYDTSYDMSETPFIFNKTGDKTVQSGEARFKMSGNGKVKIIAESGKTKIYIDVDGDGTYELHNNNE